MKEKKLSIDVNRKFPFMADTNAAATDTAAAETNTASSPTLKSKQAMTAPISIHKKIMNIPIGDVRTDPDYDRDVSASYILPASYLKYHRRIEAHDSDPSTEYVADKKDEAWLNTLPSRGTVPKDLARTLTIDVLETVFNLLERYTAQSKEPIPLINAQHLVLEKLLGWNDAACMKLLPEVYSYWKNKRIELQKPLCRKYWPQVNSSDTNPHSVFRARDKEKYRLRKQHKRNDIESFRKMQQLRKEFAKAQTLMQLVFERESLREAEFQIQREIFDAQVFHLIGGAGDSQPPPINGIASEGIEESKDLTASSEGTAMAPKAVTSGQTIPPPPITLPARRAAPFRYKLKCEHILYPPQPNLDAQGGNLGNIAALNIASGGNKKKKKKKDLYGDTMDLGAGAAEKGFDVKDKNGKLQSVDGSGVIGAFGEKRKHKKKDRNKLQTYNFDSNGNKVLISDGVVETSTNGAVNEPVSAGANNVDAAAAEAELDPRRVHPDLEGPKFLCQPSWPSFMSNNPLHERKSVVRSVADYIHDLEFRYIPANSRFNNTPQFHYDGYQWHPANSSIAAAAGIPFDSPFGPYRTEEELLPSKFRARCRVGRGGRMVVDRIPIYKLPSADNSTFAADEAHDGTLHVDATNRLEIQSQVSYLQPTSLSYRYPANSYRQHFGDAGNSGSHAKNKPKPPIARAGGVRNAGKYASKDGSASNSFALFKATSTGGDSAPDSAGDDVISEINETQSMLSAAAGGSDFNSSAASNLEVANQDSTEFLELLPISNFQLEAAACRYRMRKKMGASGISDAAAARKSNGSSSGGAVGNGSGSSNAGNLTDINTSNYYAYSTRFPSMPKIPPLMPTARPYFDAKQIAKLKEILRKDDGEEIQVMLPKHGLESEIERQQVSSLLSAFTSNSHVGGNVKSQSNSAGSGVAGLSDLSAVKFNMQL